MRQGGRDVSGSSSSLAFLSLRAWVSLPAQTNQDASVLCLQALLASKVFRAPPIWP